MLTALCEWKRMRRRGGGKDSTRLNKKVERERRVEKRRRK
jgi:hypothetical protein